MTDHDAGPTPAEAPLDAPAASGVRVDAVAHAAAECPECFVELQQDRHWWLARPAGSRLVGVVVSRDDMPPIKQQRDDLAAFGVPIDGFRHPAPETMETWEQRLVRLFGTLARGDVVVVASVHALGRDTDEENRTLSALRGRGIVVKVLGHGKPHLLDAAREATA